MGSSLSQVAARAAAEGQSRFPGVEVDLERFAAFLSEAGRTARPAAFAELFLAFGCAQQDAAALRHFDAHCLRAVPRAIAPLSSETALADDVIQQLRVRFFVSSPPKILEYLGQGSLEGWVRAAAVRLAIDMLRARAAANDAALEDELFREAAPQTVELAIMRQRHAAQFRAAFLRAFGGLSAREAAVLKLHLIDRASIDSIAEVYGTEPVNADETPGISI